MNHNIEAAMRPHLTPVQLAERWGGCSVGWLANQRSAGVGPMYIKLGAKILYPLDAVLAYEAAATVRAVA